jgi:hypothetical protein
MKPQMLEAFALVIVLILMGVLIAYNANPDLETFPAPEALLP